MIQDSLLHDVEDDDETDGGDVHVDEVNRVSQCATLSTSSKTVHFQSKLCCCINLVASLPSCLL